MSIGHRLLGILALAAFVGTIVLANHLTNTYGFVSVGFGLAATAGTFAAGAALGFRDAVQEGLGRVAVVLAILAGALISWWVAPAFAVASGTAFLVSEFADFTVYTPLRERRLMWAVFLSGLVGAAVDTVLFLWLAFGWASVSLAWKGQMVGKLWMVLAALVLIAAYRTARPRRRVATA